jgi:Trk K+ transport system NAD-binding subunit
MRGVSTHRSNHFIVIGADGLTYRLAEQLSTRYGAEVVVLMTPDQQLSARDFGELDAVSVVVCPRIDEKALLDACLLDAAGLALTVQDDVGNIHLALRVREVAPNIQLVVRMYNTDLGHNIEALLGDCKVLSDAEIAAPVLVATALGEIAATPVSVAGRTLVVALRSEVDPEDVVCGLADTGTAGGAQVLPADQESANLVLAQQRESKLESTIRLGTAKPQKTSRLRLAGAFLQAMVSRKTRIAVTVVLSIIVAAGAVLGYLLRVHPWDSFYLSAVTALGGIQPDATLNRTEQGLQLLLALAGLAFIPLVTALVVEGMVRARLALAEVRLRAPHADHVVVVGLGGVGTRVLRLLFDRGVKIVAIAPDETARGVALARELNIPLVIGDPSRETTLRVAGVERCRAMMAVSNNDIANLQAALHGRRLQERLHVVLRVFDGDLASRVRRTFNLPLSRSVSYLAAPAFAEALMDRDVIGTISVERRVLLAANVFVRAESTLEGLTVSEIDQPGQVKVIAVTEFGEPRPLWRPSPTRRVRTGDRLTVVATRDGLSGLTLGTDLLGLSGPSVSGPSLN